MSILGTLPLYEISENIESIKKIMEHAFSGVQVPLFRVQTEANYQKEKEDEREKAAQFFAQQNQSGKIKPE